MSEQVWWFVTRATGMVTWALATATVLWGLGVTSKPFGKKPAPAWMLDLHRYLGALTMLFLAGHLGALVADTFTTWTLVDLAVPYANPWKPGAVAWGIIAAWLLVAVEVSSVLLRHLPRVWWRRLHLTSYAVFVAATLHFLAAGTDAEHPAVRITVAAAAVAVGALTAFRIRQGRQKAKRRAAPSAGTGRRPVPSRSGPSASEQAPSAPAPSAPPAPTREPVRTA